MALRPIRVANQSLISAQVRHVFLMLVFRPARVCVNVWRFGTLAGWMVAWVLV